MNKTFEFIDEMNLLVQEGKDAKSCMEALPCCLGKFTESNVMLIDLEGKILAFHNESLTVSFLQNVNNGDFLEQSFSDGLKRLMGVKFNIMLETLLRKEHVKTDSFAIVMPVVAYMKRTSTILLYKKNEFSPEDLILTQYFCIIAAVILFDIEKMDKSKEVNSIDQVRAAMGTLTYSELEATVEVFKELSGSEGIIIASKIAGRTEIARSAIVNALRKLESGGIVEARSLGMKGTHIKIKNLFLIGELAKL